MFCCPHCSHLSTILNNIVEPESGVTILLTTVNNVGSKTLFNPVFINYCNNLIVISRVLKWDGWMEVGYLATVLS